MKILDKFRNEITQLFASPVLNSLNVYKAFSLYLRNNIYFLEQVERRYAIYDEREKLKSQVQ
jgi:hypothetical protein